MKAKTAAVTYGCFCMLIWLVCIAASLVIPTLIVFALFKYIRS